MEIPKPNTSSTAFKMEHTSSQMEEDTAHPLRTTAAIQDWLVTYVARELEVAPQELDVTIPFDRYGLSSVTIISLTGELEDWLGIEIDPTLPYDYSTIATLAEYLGR